MRVSVCSSGSHGDADAAIASGIGVPVAHQNSAVAQLLHEFGVRFADAHQNKIGVARPVTQPETGKFQLQSLAIAPDLRNIAVDILLILKRIGQNGKRGRVDAVGRGNAADHRHLPRVARKHADS